MAKTLKKRGAMARFTLKPGRWYACELIGDEFEEDRCSYSPIRVENVEQLKTGRRRLKLHFYHANYPEGVRDKVYFLQLIERARTYLLAKSIEHDPVRYIQVYAIDEAWLRRHFPSLEIPKDNWERWLSDHL